MTGAPAISVTPVLPPETSQKAPVGGLGALLRWK
ncbi:Peptide chain release factor 1 OS=Streptomyces tendae OX=1932 GN=GUR47_01375 PE=4 SV=1 [Streptomyces tendae]